MESCGKQAGAARADNCAMDAMYMHFVRKRMAELSDTRIQCCIQAGSGYNWIQWPDTITIITIFNYNYYVIIVKYILYLTIIT